VTSEIERRITYLVEAGELTADEGERLCRLLLRREFSQSADQKEVEPVAEVPSRNDVARLHAQVDALTQAIDQLLRERRQQ